MTLTILSSGFLVPLLAASIAFCGIMAGLFFAYSVSVVLALDTLSASAYTTVMQSINEKILNVVFGIAFLGAIVAPAVVGGVVLLRGEWATQYGSVTLAGVVVYLVGTAGVTVGVHIPMNDYIATWDADAPPDDWDEIRARWTRWNHVRTTAAVVSFLLLLAALVSLSA